MLWLLFRFLMNEIFIQCELDKATKPYETNNICLPIKRWQWTIKSATTLPKCIICKTYITWITITLFWKHHTLSYAYYCLIHESLNWVIIQILACRLSGGKPLTKRVMSSYLSHPKKQTSMQVFTISQVSKLRLKIIVRNLSPHYPGRHELNKLHT